VREPRSPVTPTVPHPAATEQRRIALDLLAKGPRCARHLAPLLPASVGAKSKDPARRRREVAGALFRALEEEGLVKGPDAEGFFWKVRS
jgi:hypothetical protein